MEEKLSTPAVLRRVNDSKGLRLTLKLTSHLISAYAVAIFFVYLYYCTKLGWDKALLATVLLAVPYIAVTALRYFVNAPRPYEVYDIYTVPPKNRRGKSFPSRHVFSAFLIATAAMSTIPIPAAILFCLSALLAISRVLLGIHFTRDCTCGAMLGIICGELSMLIL